VAKVLVVRGRRYPRWGWSRCPKCDRVKLLYYIKRDRLWVAWCRRCIEE
jgi:hypothetical protein